MRPSRVMFSTAAVVGGLAAGAPHKDVDGEVLADPVGDEEELDAQGVAALPNSWWRSS